MVEGTGQAAQTEDQSRRDVEGNPIVGRGILLLFTDDLDVLYMPVAEVERRGRELGGWLYSNCPESFSDAVVGGYHDAGKEGADKGG